MGSSKYIPTLSRGIQVRIIGPDHHAKNGQQGTIIGFLPNPYERAGNQWYDVRFDDGSIGRFLERHLVRIDAHDENTTA